MQDVRFDSVESCLDYLPPDERRITDRLRAIILDTMPDATEKLTYNVPFYRRHSNICFIWPGSVPWGQVRTHGVRLGFTQGHRLADEWGYLEAGSRKQVYVRDHFELSDIHEDKMRELLFQAVVIDEAMALRPKKKH